MMCLIGAGGWRAQQSAKTTPEIPGAVTPDSEHYTIEFENEYVRVLRIHYGPHEQGNIHNHPH